MTMTRRDALKGLFVGGIAAQVPTAGWAMPHESTFTLSNGLRTHFSTNRSGYVSAALVLRSKHIANPRGLGHIMEHTSFTGAAGSLTAKQVKALHSDRIQDSNASTGRGVIQWNASQGASPLPHWRGLCWWLQRSRPTTEARSRVGC